MPKLGLSVIRRKRRRRIPFRSSWNGRSLIPRPLPVRSGPCSVPHSLSRSSLLGTVSSVGSFSLSLSLFPPFPLATTSRTLAIKSEGMKVKEQECIFVSGTAILPDFLFILLKTFLYGHRALRAAGRRGGSSRRVLQWSRGLHDYRIPQGAAQQTECTFLSLHTAQCDLGSLVLDNHIISCCRCLLLLLFCIYLTDYSCGLELIANTSYIPSISSTHS